jgi:hypothetical protein
MALLFEVPVIPPVTTETDAPSKTGAYCANDIVCW